jgi:energy-coupling factor transporter ATP-binding protein EcfA2
MPMSIWDSYPPTYRACEVEAIVTATRAGECVAVVGLSGAGKSNLLGFIAHTRSTPAQPFALVDCNQLPESTPAALFQQICQALGKSPAPAPDQALARLETLIDRRLSQPESSLALLLDRFDIFADSSAVSGNLRALRDAHKYQLTFVIALRRPLPPHSELAELFYAHPLWLGALSEEDARWNVKRYAERQRQPWSEATARRLIEIAAGYPSFLRAVCEAHAGGAGLEVDHLAAHPAVQSRVQEFLSDGPTAEELQRAGLANAPLLKACQPPANGQAANLTAKESRLLSYFQSHPGAVCEKDDLIRAVWPEDKVFERGVRDDSLAQLVRRLREKIEPDPARPKHISTLPGRGYRYQP